MIFRKNNKIVNIYRGILPISNVYRGGILVYTGEENYDYLTFTALEISTIKYTKSTVSTAQYSYDAVNWETADNVTLNLNKGDKVFFKGNITGTQSTSKYAKFTMTGKVSASGSIMSLQAGDPNDKTLKYDYEFYKLFYNCNSLVEAPELPATTLSQRCYASMFEDCTSLTTTPAILPATNLRAYCYQGMFRFCSKLTTAPELPATKLVDECYSQMFYDCSRLNYIKALFTTTPSTSYTVGWVYGVSKTGTFVKNKDATWDVTGNNGIPTGWTVETA